MATNSSPLRLAFAGTPAFAVPALDALAAAKHDICAVFTQADRPAGRGRSVQASEVKIRAVELGIPVHQPLNFKADETHELLRSLKVEAFIVVAYGLILPASALRLPRLGCLNIHASLLPRWRGAAPIQRALLAGDASTGISIMRMEQGLDTGPILQERSLSIDARDSAKTLHDRLAPLGAELICSTVEQLSRGPVQARPQSAEGVTYASKLEKSEAPIDWHDDAVSIERKVRAFNPWPVAETRFDAAQLRIWESELTPPPGQRAAPSAVAALPGTVIGVSKLGIDVACGDGALRITRLQLPGRNPLLAHQFAAAHPLLGTRFGAP